MTDLASALFLGLVVGSIYALTAFGLVLTYRTSGVFNFAHGAIGMFFAYVFFQLTQGGRMNLVFVVYDQRWHLPVPVAMVLVVGALAPAFGRLLDAVLFRRLRDAPSVVKIVATIGVLISLFGLAGVIWGSQTTLTARSIFPQHVFTVGGVRAGIGDLATILLTIALAVGLLVFLKVSPLGVRMRAVVDRPDVAELMGVDSGKVSATAWMIGAAFAALGGILVVPFFGSLDPATLSFLVVTATAAAVVGRLESLPLTLAGGFGIGAVQFVIQRYAPSDLARQLQPSVPFVILFVVLLLPIPFRELSERSAAPARRRRDGSRRARALTSAVVVAALVVPALVLGPAWRLQLATVPPMALLFLSLVLLSGHAGQISLSQAAFAGVGAFVAAHLVADHGWPFFGAAIVGAAAAVPLGALLAVRAARLPPLFLGFATLAFGALMDQIAFTSQGFSGGLAGIAFQRPSIVSGPLAYYAAGLVAFGLFAVLVRNVRRGRTGLALAAMRDSQTALSSLGTNVAELKFTVFCLSAFIAGLAGAMLAGASSLATPYNFFEIQSLLVLALAVLGGIGLWSGALVGAALFQLSAPILHQPFIQQSFVGRVIFHGQLEALLPVFFGLGAIGLARNPYGLVEQVRDGATRLKDIVTRGVAAVPSPSPAPGAVRAPLARSGGDGLITFAGATLFHLRTCLLTPGKDPIEVDTGALDALRACPICQPDVHADAVGNG